MRCVSLALTLLCCGVPASAAISFVQKNTADNSGAANTSLSVAFSLPTTPGDLIVVYVVPGTSQPGAIAVTDSVGNTYYPASSTFTTGQCSMAQEFFYAANIAGGPDAITATTTTQGGMALVILEYSGVAAINPLDAQAGSSQTTCPWTNLPSSASITTTNANDLIVTGAVMVSTWTAGTGYTLRTARALQFATADQVVSSIGTYTAAFNLSEPASWIASAVAFRGAGGGGILCGQPDDRQVHIPPQWDTFTGPAIGQSYIDPTFGCTVKRLTNSSAEDTAWDGSHLSFMDYYSTFTPINATDTMLFINSNDGNWRIKDLNGNVVVPVSNLPIFSGHPIWDASNANVFYYTSYNVLYSGTVSGNSMQRGVVHTFAEYSGIISPDAADLSQDGDHIALVGQNADNTMDLFVWSLSQQTKTSVYKTTCTVNGSVTGTAQPGCMHKLQLTADNLLTIEFQGDGSGLEQGLRLWNGSTLVHLQDKTSHYDSGYDLAGNSVFISQNNFSSLPGLNDPCPDGWGMDVRQLTNLQSAICLIDYQPFWHISYRGGAAQPWIVLSFFDARTPAPEFFTSNPNYQIPTNNNWQLYEDEVVVAKIDGSAVYRLAHARSRSRESYWAQPRAAISRDGKYVVFSSNMAFSNGCPANMHVPGECTDVYLINIQR